MALEEIENLRSQVSELKDQIRQQQSAEGNNINNQERLDLRSQTLQLENQRELTTIPHRTDLEGRDTLEASSSNEMLLHCRGILTRSNTGSVCHFYGLSSLQNLVHRMKTHLYLAHGWVYLEENLHPRPITLSFASSSGLAVGNSVAAYQSPADWNEGVFMGKDQEEECLRLFWQSYQCAIPILDERRFQEHHSLLWGRSKGPDQYRDDSALVDVMIAISLQYGMTHIQGGFNLPDTDSEYSITDPSNAGRWYFQRSQSLLKSEFDNPSILLLQCQILSVVYLRDASLFNMALSTLAAAIQTSYALGVHMDVKELGDPHERELSKRLWCMVFVLEGKMFMDCGRPFLTQKFGIQMPRDNHELASSSAEMFVPSSKLKITWLTYHVEHVKLIRTSREVFSKVYNQVAHLLVSKPGEEFGQDTELLNRCDELLVRELNSIKRWSETVPQDLKYHLNDSGNPVDGDVWRTNTVQKSPLWLQRQRVMLRLLYHDIFITLCRPFVTFPSPNETIATPTKSALECLQHAISVTNIAYQVLNESDILHGWHRAYQFQWDAALFMIAFAFGNLTSPLIEDIHIKLEHATFVLDTFGRCFAIARSAAEIIRDLHGRLNSTST